MLFPIELTCQHCSAIVTIKLNINDTALKHPCPSCGGINQGIFGLEVSIGWKIFLRAAHELLGRDYSMCVVLAAMSIEAELARLFFKWKEIDYDLAHRFAPEIEFDKENAEEEFRKLGNTRDKIELIAEFLHPQGFQNFVFAPENQHYLSALKTVFTTIDTENISASIQREIFWRRNQVLHQGKTSLIDMETADFLLRLAGWMLEVLRLMDHERNRSFQAAMK